MGHLKQVLILKSKQKTEEKELVHFQPSHTDPKKAKLQIFVNEKETAVLGQLSSY